jgi:hypothetical protein
MIPSSFTPADESFLNEADVILLAGGDVGRGWRVFSQTGLAALIVKRYYEGASLIGISAGAVQLGSFGLVQEGSREQLIGTFKLVPFMIGAHEEGQAWERLQGAIGLLNGSATGIGIPTGGGLIYFPGGSIEAIRYPLREFSIRGGRISSRLRLPTRWGEEKSIE